MLSIWLFLLLLAILYHHMIMYVGLFGDSAVVSHVFMFFKCFPVFFCVLLTFVWLCGCVFQRHSIDIFSCIAASLFIELTYLLTYLLTDWLAGVVSLHIAATVSMSQWRSHTSGVRGARTPPARKIHTFWYLILRCNCLSLFVQSFGRYDISWRFLIVRPTWQGSWTGTDRKECYRLTHPP